jgi:phage terminase small subunit
MSEKSNLGPHMRALTEKQRGFVVACVEHGMNYSRAYAAAGYSAGLGGEIARAEGYKLARHPKIILAMREEAETRLTTGALIGAVAVMEIAMDAMHKDRFKAAERLLNQNGFGITTRHEVHVTDHRTTQELIERAHVLAAKLGMDPKALLGEHTAPAQLPAPIDAEYEEVGSTEGLEDLL